MADLDLSGKTILITGGSGAIGRVLVRALTDPTVHIAANESRGQLPGAVCHYLGPAAAFPIALCPLTPSTRLVPSNTRVPSSSPTVWTGAGLTSLFLSALCLLGSRHRPRLRFRVR